MSIINLVNSKFYESPESFKDKEKVHDITINCQDGDIYISSFIAWHISPVFRMFINQNSKIWMQKEYPMNVVAMILWHSYKYIVLPKYSFEKHILSNETIRCIYAYAHEYEISHLQKEIVNYMNFYDIEEWINFVELYMIHDELLFNRFADCIEPKELSNIISHKTWPEMLPYVVFDSYNIDISKLIIKTWLNANYKNLTDDIAEYLFMKIKKWDKIDVVMIYKMLVENFKDMENKKLYFLFLVYLSELSSKLVIFLHNNPIQGDQVLDVLDDN